MSAVLIVAVTAVLVAVTVLSAALRRTLARAHQQTAQSEAERAPLLRAYVLA